MNSSNLKDSLDSGSQLPNYLRTDIDASLWKNPKTHNLLDSKEKYAFRKGVNPMENGSSHVPNKTLWESLSRTRGARLLPLNNQAGAPNTGTQFNSTWSHAFSNFYKVENEKTERIKKLNEEKLKFTPMRSMQIKVKSAGIQAGSLAIEPKEQKLPIPISEKNPDNKPQSVAESLRNRFLSDVDDSNYAFPRLETPKEEDELGRARVLYRKRIDEKKDSEDEWYHIESLNYKNYRSRKPKEFLEMVKDIVVPKKKSAKRLIDRDLVMLQEGSAPDKNTLKNYLRIMDHQLVQQVKKFRSEIDKKSGNPMNRSGTFNQNLYKQKMETLKVELDKMGLNRMTYFKNKFHLNQESKPLDLPEGIRGERLNESSFHQQNKYVPTTLKIKKDNTYREISIENDYKKLADLSRKLLQEVYDIATDMQEPKDKLEENSIQFGEVLNPENIKIYMDSERQFVFVSILKENYFLFEKKNKLIFDRILLGANISPAPFNIIDQKQFQNLMLIAQKDGVSTKNLVKFVIQFFNVYGEHQNMDITEFNRVLKLLTDQVDENIIAAGGETKGLHAHLIENFTYTKIIDQRNNCVNFKNFERIYLRGVMNIHDLVDLIFGVA